MILSDSGSRPIHFMDFDGTITKGDSMFSFLKFISGTFFFYILLAIAIPTLIILKLAGGSNQSLKVKLLQYFFKGKKKSELESLAFEHFQKRKNKLLRTKAVGHIKSLQDLGDEICIVTASLDLWVQPFAAYLGAELIATQSAYDQDGFFIGISGLNCNYEEKVNRIKDSYNGRQINRKKLAYGNSSGDQAMYEFSDQYYHKYFD